MVKLLGIFTRSRFLAVGWICSAGLALLVFSVLMSRSLVTIPQAESEEDGYWEAFIEWGMLAPAGDISPPQQGGGESFIHGAITPVGLDVTTQYLQQVMVSGSEFLFSGPEHDSAGLSTITYLNYVPLPNHEGLAAREDEPVSKPDEPVAVDKKDPPSVAAVTHHDDAAPDGDDEIPDGVDDSAEADLTVVPLPVQGEVIVPYGWVECPTLGEWIFHPGIDIEAPVGADVRSVTGGRVESVDSSTCMGVTVCVLSNGLIFVYSGMQESSVSPGDSVAPDTALGTVGPSPLREVALPPHLHWEVRDAEGEPVEIELTEEGVRLCR